MNSDWAYVSATLVTTGGGIIIAMIHKFRKENREDHNIVHNSLLSIKEDIKTDLHGIKSDFKDINKKLDNHIDWHLE